MLAKIERGVAVLVLFHLFRVFRQRGPKGVFGELTTWLRGLPFVDEILTAVIHQEAQKAVQDMTHSKGSSKTQKKSKTRLELPLQGLGADVVKELRAKSKKFNPQKDGADDSIGVTASRVFALVYKGDEEHEKALEEVYREWKHTNGLNPTVFGGLRQIENEVVAMCATMLGGLKEGEEDDDRDDICGTMTSGGTESIIMAIKTYRDRAKALYPRFARPDIVGEIVAPITVHPAFEKAAHYFGLKVVHVPLLPDTYHVDLQAYKKAISLNTVLLVVSAPQYCHGIIDPVEEVAEMAIQFGLPLHVDACFGGFMVLLFSFL